jgi:hypothetical protein
MIRPVEVALIMAAASGFVAGKLDLDDKIRQAIHNQNVRIAQLNAQTLADELEGRKIGFPVNAPSQEGMQAYWERVSKDTPGD